MSGSNEPTVVLRRHLASDLASCDLALPMYRAERHPHVSASGLYYGEKAPAQFPYVAGIHVTVTPEIEVAVKSVVQNDYDFLLMAGALETQFQDILSVAKAQFFSHRASPLYVQGGMLPQTFDLLCLFGSQYNLKSIYNARNGAKIPLH